MWWSNGPQLATVTLHALPWSSSKAFSNWPFWDAWSGRNVASTKDCYKLGPWQSKISELSPKVFKFILYCGSMGLVYSPTKSTNLQYKSTIHVGKSTRPMDSMLFWWIGRTWWIFGWDFWWLKSLGVRVVFGISLISVIFCLSHLVAPLWLVVSVGATFQFSTYKGISGI